MTPQASTEPETSECAEKARLLREYQIAVADFSRAVQLLLERSGVMRKTEYLQIRDYSEKARLLSETARRELDLHTADHGC